MKRFTPTPDACRLLVEGQIALAEVENFGVCVDKAYLESAIASCDRQVREIEDEMRRDDVYRLWHRRFRDSTKLTAPEQLAKVIFGDMGYPHRGHTRSGKRYSAAESALQHVDLPFVKNYFKAAKLRKARDTYLHGIRREMVRHGDGTWRVHPSYNLNTVATFRSSCDSPNFQNVPVRNPMMSEMVRRTYVPRPGHQILEIDQGQVEVRLPCPYTNDPVLMAYVNDPKLDMHRDTACKLFFLKPDQVSKEVRHVAKNEMVFPTFYGSYYAQIAPNIWETIDRRKLTVAGSGVSVRDHLAANGITELGACDPRNTPAPGTFEAHCKKIESWFWDERFTVYRDWKKAWIEAYHENGGCMFLTGFPMYGPHKRNDITNYPIQGSAFHVGVLWPLPRIVNHLRRYKFRTRVIGEIHDSIQFDAHPRERDDVIDFVVRMMTKDVRNEFRWLNVPLVVEVEACPIDAPWFDKVTLVESGGTWVPAKPDDWERKYGAWENQVIA